MGCSSSGPAAAGSPGKASTLPDLTPGMKKTLRESWEKFLEVKNDRDQTYGYLIFARLFVLHPKSMEIFNFIDDPSEDALYSNIKLDKHVGRVAGALTSVIDNLDQLDVVAETLKALGERHAAYGATAAYMTGVNDGLKYALESALKDKFTEDVAQAWAVLLAYAFHFVTEGLNNGEAKLEA